MNKKELIDAISNESGLTKVQSEHAVNAFISSVTNALQEQDSVTLVGFGSFTVGERAARTGRNPKTGAAIKIAATSVPRFKAGKALKDAVANKKKKKK